MAGARCPGLARAINTRSIEHILPAVVKQETFKTHLGLALATEPRPALEIACVDMRLAAKQNTNSLFSDPVLTADAALCKQWGVKAHVKCALFKTNR